MKKSRGIIIILVTLICLGLLGWYSYDIIHDTGEKQRAMASEGDVQVDKENSGIKLGLDLSGGVSITYRIKDENPSQSDIDDTKKKLEERAEHYSTEYSVYQVGDDRITVEIPGVYDANKVLEDLGSPGSLYFITQKNKDGEANYTYDASAEGGYKLNFELEELIENGSAIISGDDVKSANAASQTDSTGKSEFVVQLTLNDSAAEVFGEATTAALASGESIGIYYDDHFVSVPKVSAAINDGNCVINGMGSYEEANELATFIRIGSMKLELEELESQVVGASLGSEALSSSMKAALIGLILVMIFMIVMYAVSGVAASVALGIYTTLVVALIYLFEITLTLPGIAGIILGIGMAVDANVIIFARIREEIAAGKTVGASINEGYKKALSAILDGQITTFIAALVLMVLGSGTVRGFAYTLMISILVSLFSALVVSKYFMRALFAIGLKGEKFYGRAKERKPFDFMKHRIVYFVISIAIILVGVAGMIGFKASGNGALNFSLEFVGGTSTTVEMNKAYTIAELDSDVIPVIAEALGESESNIQATTVDGTNKVVLKTRTLELEERDILQDTLVEKFDVDESTIENQSISSTISGEMRRDAVIAVIIACIFMLLYIWFRFKDIRFATSAIAALVHDVLVVLTAYALVRISVGNTFIACMLTIVGYSVNDTIVIFDRVRENLRGVKYQTPEVLAEVANKSLTQTLSRSISTSITTIIMVLLLYILGVSSIREFALPLMVGMVCGTYSSIFIATELWYVMKLHFGKKRVK